MATKTETPANKAPNLGIRKRLETQLKLLTQKCNHHTNQAESYNAAAESVQKAIEALAQPQPGLFTEK